MSQGLAFTHMPMHSFTHLLMHLPMHFLGGLMLLCGFALLAQRRFAGMLTLYRLAALALSAAIFWQGCARLSAGLILAALLTLAVKPILLPRALHRLPRHPGASPQGEMAMPAALALILGLALTAIAMQAGLSGPLPPAGPADLAAREPLALALAVVLLGLLLMAVRRQAPAQFIGFLMAENGLVLAAIGMPGMPFAALLILALLAFSLAGLLTLRLRAESGIPASNGLGPAGGIEV